MKTQLSKPARTKARYTEEYKQEALKLWRNSGRSAAKVAAELGIRAPLLYRWARPKRQANLSGNESKSGRSVEELEAEIRRSQRTQRGFAVLLLDVDGLKRINDRHGHLVGSRALCRLAEVLHMSCRAVDTAARYGGDEFALVLPETDDTAALQVAARVSERLGKDVEAPRIKASMGVACFPRDGNTAEAILSSADRALYAMKTGSGSSGGRAR